MSGLCGPGWHEQRNRELLEQRCRWNRESVGPSFGLEFCAGENVPERAMMLDAGQFHTRVVPHRCTEWRRRCRGNQGCDQPRNARDRHRRTAAVVRLGADTREGEQALTTAARGL